MRALSLAVWLCGCSSTDGVEPDPAEVTPDDTAGESLPDYRDAAPQWTAEQSVAYVTEVFGYGWPDPQHARNVFHQLLALGDEECPGNDFQRIGTLPGCWSASGYWYMGLGHFSWDESEGMTEDGHPFVNQRLGTIYGDFEILTPSGTEYTSGGGMDWERTTYADRVVARVGVRGSWQWTGSDRPWFAESISGDFQAMATAGVGHDSLMLNGAYGVDRHYLYFDFLSMRGGPCGWQPSGGSVTLRQDDQSSTVLTFSDDCSGCASVSWEGEQLGQACTDWSAFAQDAAATTIGLP